MSKSSFKRRIAQIPVIGYVIQWVWQIITLPRKFDEVERMSTRIGKTAELVEQLKQANPVLADNHSLDDFYMHFENAFRGTEDEIKDRLKVYLPYLRKLKVDYQKYPLLDIGCGRGEMLKLAKEHNIRAIGLDLNEAMVNICHERGYEAVQDDALNYLRKQKTGSHSVITGFHIVEHLPFGILLDILNECSRVLMPGGLVIFETPNPENIDVGSNTFYYDPSHLHPLSPPVFSWTVGRCGFDKVDILRLHPSGDGHENDVKRDKYLAELVRRFYTSRAYAVIGYKAK
jgi:SAM-dependent methyltransferase